MLEPIIIKEKISEEEFVKLARGNSWEGMVKLAVDIEKVIKKLLFE